MATPAVFTDCRFCLEKKRHVLPINEEMSKIYHTVTQIKLAKLHSYSNSVCLLCYKKLLSAQSYREMLIQIEQKLLSTFNHTAPKSIQQQQTTASSSSNNKAIRSNGKPTTPITKIPAYNNYVDTTVNARKFARQQINKHVAQTTIDDDEDMSLLEEIVSIDAPNVSDFFNEQGQSNFYPNLLSEEDTKPDMEDESSSFNVKDEPEEDKPLIEVNEPILKYIPEKPYKCTIPGCRQSSTTRSALQKHRRRVHGIRMRQSPLGGKITRSKPSQLYSELDLSSNVFKCKFCNLHLRNRRVLLRHIETVHMQAKFYCTVLGCNHASTRKDNYRLHLKNYHRDLPETEMERVLNETRNMKPIYKNNLTDLQMNNEIQGEIEMQRILHHEQRSIVAKQETFENNLTESQIKKEFDGEFHEIDDDDDDNSSQSMSKNGEMSGFSFINIEGGVVDHELL